MTARDLIVLACLAALVLIAAANQAVHSIPGDQAYSEPDLKEFTVR